MSKPTAPTDRFNVEDKVKEVKEDIVVARGTTDLLADTRRQKEIGTPHFGRPTGDWDLIHGELVTFTDPRRDLPPIDRLEGFRPGGHSMYQRVMVAVLCGRTSIPACTYLPCPPCAERVASGQWLRREPIFAALSGPKRLTIGPCLKYVRRYFI